MAGRQLAALVLSDAERRELTSLAARRNTAQALALRARIVLRCATGSTEQAGRGRSASLIRTHRWQVAPIVLPSIALMDWQAMSRVSGTPRTIDDARIEAVIVRTLESVPADATHWSSRGMARACGLSVSTVQRIWRAFGLQPHRLGELQALHRSGLRRQSPRCGRALCFAAGPCRRALRRREVANPGAGPQPADAADASRPAGRGAAMTISVMAPHRCSPLSTSLPAG